MQCEHDADCDAVPVI
ncbi:uncharacterized protein FFB20_09115 [Fusarium fujikuroi]|nr:uncharacterized protein FFB20_09115 [Fusarium fujikuroi]SCO24000.1 uncharacterized protein FFE2_15837 [Fusarium fujikuroi]SCO26810.1 uncharacterized protein FFM5_15079 [Fusarium fujikuroi]SCO58659.1 uncharacterized protein FFMR_15815 [Fusarium fujikuroi]